MRALVTIGALCLAFSLALAAGREKRSLYSTGGVYSPSLLPALGLHPSLSLISALQPSDNKVFSKDYQSPQNLIHELMSDVKDLKLKLKILEAVTGKVKDIAQANQMGLEELGECVAQAKDDLGALETRVGNIEGRLGALEGNKRLKTCPADFPVEGPNGKCYFFSQESADFVTANTVCQSNLGGILAEPDNTAENEFLKFYAAAIGENYWIGLVDDTDTFGEVENSFVWLSDRRSTDFDDWNAGQPNDTGGDEDCAELRGVFDYRWNDLDCDNHNYYICEIAKHPGA